MTLQLAAGYQNRKDIPRSKLRGIIKLTVIITSNVERCQSILLLLDIVKFCHFSKKSRFHGISPFFLFRYLLIFPV